MTIYSGYLILFQLADSFLLTNALKRGDDGTSSPNFKGIYDRGQPLVQLGLMVFANVDQVFDGKNQQLFEKSAKMYLRLTIGTSASAVGLAILLPYINFALFKDGSGNAALVLFVFPSL